MHFSFNSTQGRRPHHEDRASYFSLPEAKVFCIFDGHGGEGTAQYLQDHVMKAFVDAMQRQGRVNAIKQMQDVIKFCIFTLSTETSKFSSGSTLSMVVIPSEDLGGEGIYTVVIGDSPIWCFECYPDVELWNYGTTHNLKENAVELLAARERGGVDFSGTFYANRIFNPNGDALALGRALGDADFGKIISKEPEIDHFPTPKRILLMSDGLIEYPDFLPINDKALTATMLTDAAYKAGSRDNLTAFVISP
jgi:serine/threonine protein phosphatase PrpC